MRNASVWRALLGVEKTVVEGVEFDEDAGCAGRAGPADGGRAGPVRALFAAQPGL